MKSRILTIFFYMFIAFGVLLILIWRQSAPAAMSSHAPLDLAITKSFQDDIDQMDEDSLKLHFGENKILPQGYEKAALIALSHYPSLKKVHIVFELNRESAPLEATFQYHSLIGFGERKYCIRLNIGTNTRLDEILLYNLPLDAQIGILAHELGHIEYYRQLNLLGIAKWGLQYVFNENYRAAHEKATDLMPVDHGLGWQIYDYARFIRYDESTRESYEQFGEYFIDKYYLTDKEILTYMQNLHYYQ